METTNNNNTGSPALADPLQTQGTLAPTPPERLGLRMLELACILQTTLDLQTQIDLFGKEIQCDLSVGKLIYTPADSDEPIAYGHDAPHRATYSLVLHEKPLGSIQVCRNQPFDEPELMSLENLLCTLIYPLRNALAYQQAVELASRDPLTGVQSRLAMETALAREIGLSRRQDQPLSMLVIDIDRFKAFNDTFGHAFGDDVLLTTAQTIISTIRRSDLLFRFGGEEFVVIASHTGQQGAMLLAERIREKVAAIPTVRGQSTTITVSIGVAELRGKEEKDAFFERADKALYEAKNSGRNRSVPAEYKQYNRSFHPSEPEPCARTCHRSALRSSFDLNSATL